VSGSDAYATALNLLARRELSEAQVRDRLTRRGFDASGINAAVARLAADRAIDDRRVATAVARLEALVRVRGRQRVLQKVRALGIADDVAREAVAAAFEDVDEDALIERAVARRLRGRPAAGLDRTSTRKLVAALVRQGFAAPAVLAWLGRQTRRRLDPLD
jgi:regulatory protein